VAANTAAEPQPGLLHKGCGGAIAEDLSVWPYEYVRTDVTVELHHVQRCVECGAETVRGAQVETPWENEAESLPQTVIPRTVRNERGRAPIFARFWLPKSWLLKEI
jgi:hypothetical protein